MRVKKSEGVCKDLNTCIADNLAHEVSMRDAEIERLRAVGHRLYGVIRLIGAFHDMGDYAKVDKVLRDFWGDELPPGAVRRTEPHVGWKYCRDERCLTLCISCENKASDKRTEGDV